MDPLLCQVAEVRAEANYTLWIRFEDGVEGRVCLSPLVGKGKFRAWLDEEAFREVSIDPRSNVLSWESGIELDADVLYYDLINKAKLAMH